MKEKWGRGGARYGQLTLKCHVLCWSSVRPHRAIANLLQPASTQCGVGPVCPHRAIVNLLQPASTHYEFDPVCVPIELLSTYFNLPQPSGMF